MALSILVFQFPVHLHGMLPANWDVGRWSPAYRYVEAAFGVTRWIAIMFPWSSLPGTSRRWGTDRHSRAASRELHFRKARPGAVRTFPSR